MKSKTFKTNTSIRQKFKVLIASVVIIMAIVLGTSLWVIDHLRIDGDAYKRIMMSKNLVSDILPPTAYIIEPYLLASEMLAGIRNQDAEFVIDTQQKMEVLEEQYYARQNYWIAHITDPWLRELFQESGYKGDEFFRQYHQNFLPSLNDPTQNTAAMADLRKIYNEHRHLIDILVVAANKNNVRITNDMNSMAGNAFLFLIITSLAVVVLFPLLMWWTIRRQIITPISTLNTQVQTSLVDDAIDIAYLKDTTEIGDLARSFSAYRLAARQVSDDQWVKANLANIATKLQSQVTYNDVAKTLFSHLSPLLSLGQAALYLYDAPHKCLRRAGGYACLEGHDFGNTIAMGEGLVGECAQSQIPIMLDKLPQNYVRINSVAGVISPTSILLFPVSINDKLLAVIELAALDKLSSKAHSLLEGLLPIIAMNLQIMEANRE